MDPNRYEHYFAVYHDGNSVLTGWKLGWWESHDKGVTDHDSIVEIAKANIRTYVRKYIHTCLRTYVCTYVRT